MMKYGKAILFDGVPELLSILKNEGCYIALASTGSTSHVSTALNASGIYHLFEVIECNHADKAAMVEEIIKKEPCGEWLIVGDKTSDLLAGTANNIITVAARYGFGNEDEVSQFMYGIEYPLQLIEVIKKSIK